MGVRVSRRRDRVRRADRGCWHAVRRQRGRRRAGARRADRLRALAFSGGRSRAGRHDHRRRRQPEGARLQRSDRLGLFGRCPHGARQLEDPRRGTRGHASDRLVRGARRPGVRAGGVVGGNALDRPGLRVLHLPRERHRRPAARRVDRVEDLSGGRAEEDRDHRGGHRYVRPVRGGRVVGAHHRRRPRRALRDDRRQLLASRHGHERCRDGARTRDRPRRLDTSDHAGRRLQLGVRRARPELPGRERPRLSTTGPRPSWSGPRRGATCSWRGRSPAWSTASTRRSRARCCGRRASAPAAPTAACSGAWRAMAATSTRRCPTSGVSPVASAAPPRSATRHCIRRKVAG